MSKAEEQAFASMQEITSAPPEPEPVEPDEAEPQAAAPPAEGEEGETPEADGEDEAQSRSQPAPPPKFVRQEALREERERRQYVEAENRRMSEERARIDERLRIIEEMNRPQPPEKPAWAVDPIAAGENLEQRLERLEQGSQQWNEQQRALAEAAQIEEAARYDAAQFAQATPDYRDAYQFWVQSRGNELMALGWSPDRIPGQLIEEERNIVQQGAQRRISPASTIYNLAKARGFTGKPARNGAGNGHDDAADRQIERVATGQERNRTLSGTGGGAAPVQMTATLLATMPNDEFAEWMAKNPKAGDRLLGKEPARGRGR